jgi:hypothetical protein
MKNIIKYILYLAIPKPYAAMNNGTITRGWVWFGRVWERKKSIHSKPPPIRHR